MIPVPAKVWVLEGVEQLQQAARLDQACECMIHEYARRYNEVLREYSRQKRQLTEDEQRRAHQQAMQWVRDVWKYTDQQVVEQNLTSDTFIHAVDVFQRQQVLQYPNLTIVH